MSQNLLGFTVAFAALLFIFTGAASRPEMSKKTIKNAQIAKVVDGDEVVFTDGTLARLIGVDCPEDNLTREDEMQLAKAEIPAQRYLAYRERAAHYVEEFLKRGNIRVEIDPNHKAAGYVEHNERPLVYVYSGDVMLNAEMLREGICIREPEIYYQHVDQFRKLEEEARAAGLGIWKNHGTA